MSYYRDLRELISALESAGRLVRVKKSVNKDSELHPLVKLQFCGLPEEERKAFLFERVIGAKGREYGIPVLVGALASSPEVFAIGMKCSVDEISDKLVRAEANPVPPKLVASGPVQQIVHTGERLLEHGGLDEFPIPVATPGFDPSPYITAPCWVTKDPDTGAVNVGMYRAMLKSSTRTGINFATATRGGYLHFKKWKEKGKPMPAALVVGGPPSFVYGAVAPLPIGLSELAFAGGIAGEPLEVVRCRTVDLDVPAGAEIVVEGEVSTTEVEPEAPFGEAYGFTGPADINPFFDIKCVTHRRDPIWLATVSQHPPTESSQLRRYTNRAVLLNHLKKDLGMGHVVDAAFVEPTGALRFIIIQVDKAEREVVWQTLEATAKRFPIAKIIVAVDRDVNINDADSVNLALTMRFQPHRDCRIETLPAPALGDYSLEPMEKLAKRSPTDPERPTASRILIDATLKWPYPPTSYPRKEYMERAIRIWQDLGLPPLKMKEPWSGVDLGFWSGEDERHARLAAKGEQYAAGEDYAKQRRKA